jgi:8-oxo-dGTP pyrophosphatase MutT (NUDIX family)
VRAVSIALLAAGLAACPKRDPSVLESPVRARVTVADGGGAQLSIGEGGATVVSLPKEDRGPFVLAADDKGARIALQSGGGPWRVVYVGTQGRAFLAPDARPTLDWPRTPAWQDVAPRLFATNAERRKDVLAQVRADGGDAAVARMLARSGDVDDATWDATYGALPPERRADVVAGLRAVATERGAPPEGLARAMLLAGADVPPEAAAARLEELGPATPPASPRGLGLLMRVAARGRDVSKVACAALGNAQPDDDDRRVLVDAALLAIAKNPAPCPAVEKLLLADRCSAWLRCGPKGRVSPRDTSKQDEPLCEKAALAREIDEELALPPKDVDPGLALTPRLALMAAYAQGALPEPLVAAQSRRLYKLTQVDKPECDMGLAPGTPCHCDEAQVRDQVCRVGGAEVAFSFCKVDVDDAKKTIVKVTFTNPP